MADRLRDTIAMVTGGAGGIGSETARLFCAEGARVAIVDLSADNLHLVAASIAEDNPGATILPITADISREEEAARAVAETVVAFGGLTVLVNNAGVRAFGPISEASPASWRRSIDVNLLGTANCAKAALPKLREANAASIVNVSSVHAEVGRKGMGQYDATKAGIVSLTRTLAWEEAGNGIRVNAVLPGVIQTPMIDALEETYPGFKDALLTKHPIGRLGTPHDILLMSMVPWREMNVDHAFGTE